MALFSCLRLLSYYFSAVVAQAGVLAEAQNLRLHLLLLDVNLGTITEETQTRPEEAHIYLRTSSPGLGQCIALFLIVEGLLLVLACAAGPCVDPHLWLEVTPATAAPSAATVTTTSPACAVRINHELFLSVRLLCCACQRSSPSACQHRVCHNQLGPELKQTMRTREVS